MPTVYPTAAGPYSTRSWNNDATGAAYGGPPLAGDIVLFNNLAITQDQNITVVEIAIRAGTTAVAGGTLANSSTWTISANITGGPDNFVTLSGAVTRAINGNVVGGSTASRTAITVSAGTLNLTGNVTGGSAASSRGVLTSGSANCTIVGEIFAGTSDAIAHQSTGTLTLNPPSGLIQRSGTAFIRVAATSGLLVVNANVTGSAATSGSTIQFISGKVFIAGNVTGGGVSGSDAIVGTGAGNSLTIVGNVLGGTIANARAIDWSTGSSIYIAGNVTAGADAIAINIALPTAVDICVVRGIVTGGSGTGIGIVNSGAGGRVRIFGSSVNSGGAATSNTGGGTIEVIATGGGGAPLIGAGGLVY